MQALSRTRASESRAAELLRILYRVPKGFGERIYARSVCAELIQRRAIECQLDVDSIKDVNGTIIWRPSRYAAGVISKAAELLLAMGLAVRMSPGVYRITDAGRKECEMWYPELREDLRKLTNDQDGHHSSTVIR